MSSLGELADASLSADVVAASERFNLKRKRHLKRRDSPSSQPVQAITPESSFSSTFEERQMPAPSTPPVRPELDSVVGVESEGSVHGSASPRMMAARQLEKLSIVERMMDMEHDGRVGRGRKLVRARHYGSANKTRTSQLGDGGCEMASMMLADDEGDGNDEEEENGPAAKKRIPRGISSPKPKGRIRGVNRQGMKNEVDPRANWNRSEIGLEEMGDSADVISPGSERSPIISTSDFDFKSMTWQDSEITGHLMQDSDDDGTGINGIGFKPTPSIARQRAAQRRRQVQEWRMRQETEDRERRAARRRLQEETQSAAFVGYPNSSEMVEVVEEKKIVRFAV